MEPESPIIDAEDILFDSLQTLYDYHPITLTTQGSLFTYTTYSKSSNNSEIKDPTISITLRTPDTQASNWSLHANSIWVSSIYLADHIDNLNLDLYTNDSKSDFQEKVRVLELGASAGLPSILLTKLFPGALVTVTDYPDDELIKTLKNNVEVNKVADRCKVLPYAWGSDPTLVLGNSKGFDVVMAADTLWNPELHPIFIDTLKSTLKKSSSSRIHLVVGLHTGRYTIQAFLTHVQRNSGLHVENISEREAIGSSTRVWKVFRSGEDERERRRWIIWMTLAWEKSMIDLE